MDTASIHLGIGSHSFYIRQDTTTGAAFFGGSTPDYIFGGQSYGFKTKANNRTYDISSP